MLLGEKIKILAEKRGIETPELAIKTGISTTTLYRIYNRDTCEVEQLKKIASILGVTPSYFLEDNNDFENQNPVLEVKNDTIILETKFNNEFYEKLLIEKERSIQRLEKELERYQKREDEFFSNIKDLIKQNGNSGGSLGKLLEIRDSQPAPAKVFKVLGERMSETVGK